MASPVLKVEIAFTSDPLDTTPTWVDVTEYVRATSSGGGGMSSRRGKSPDVDRFEAGTCQVTLSNRDRRFDPSHVAGPHFGDLIPRKQIRVSATWAAVDYPMFTGNVTGWPQGFGAGGKDATVTIEAVDALAVLAGMDLPNDLVYDYADVTLGSLAFFLRQADTSNWSDATANGYSATLAEGTGRTASTIAAGAASTAVTLDVASRWVLGKNYQSAGAWSLSLWVQTTTDGASGDVMIAALNTVAGSQLMVNTSAGATNLLYQTSTPVGSVSSLTSVPVNDGNPHHVVVTSDGSTVAGYKIYIDGLDRTSGTSGSYQALTFDQLGSTESQNPASAFAGTIQDVAVFDQQLTALEVEGLYQRSHGFLQEGSADRVTRLLDDAAWPAAWREITTNPRASVGELVYNGSSVLPKLQEVERSEQGMVFATKAGFIAFRERYYANEVTVGNTVQQIFSDDNGATAMPYSTFGFQWNDIDVTNQATVTTPTTWAASSDTASITVNGRQSKKVDTILSTFDQANSMAAGLVAEGKDATYRVPPIMAYPANNDTRWDEILGLELGYRVSMEITPMGVGSQNVQEVTLEQIEWSVVDTLWTLTIAGSPCFGAGGAEVGWFTIGTSLIGGPDVIGF